MCYRLQSCLRVNPTLKLWTTGALGQWSLNALVAFAPFYTTCSLYSGEHSSINFLSVFSDIHMKTHYFEICIQYIAKHKHIMGRPYNLKYYSECLYTIYLCINHSKKLHLNFDWVLPQYIMILDKSHLWLFSLVYSQLSLVACFPAFVGQVKSRTKVPKTSWQWRTWTEKSDSPHIFHIPTISAGRDRKTHFFISQASLINLYLTFVCVCVRAFIGRCWNQLSLSCRCCYCGTLRHVVEDWILTQTSRTATQHYRIFSAWRFITWTLPLFRLT